MQLLSRTAGDRSMEHDNMHTRRELMVGLPLAGCFMAGRSLAQNADSLPLPDVKTFQAGAAILNVGHLGRSHSIFGFSAGLAGW
jgi:hypothetical protein